MIIRLNTIVILHLYVELNSSLYRQKQIVCSGYVQKWCITVDLTLLFQTSEMQHLILMDVLLHYGLHSH